ncbi:conjugal transfer protein, partial [Carbonactinospora thermoautotrophica]
LRRSRVSVDAAARHLADPRDIAHLTEAGVTATARRLGAPTTSPGVPIGRALPSRQRIYGSWEDMHLDIWGTRTGKTTSRAIPAILAAPGCLLVTSNKRDVVDATRLIRDRAGTVWVFDPHQIAGEDPTWWWNPLSYVTDVDKAMRLAAIFADFSRAVGAKQDAYFDPKGEQLLAYMLLAAAAAGEPITIVHEWLSDPTDATPVDVLRRTGHHMPAHAVQGVINYADKQRDGIYGTAEKAVSWLVNPAVTRWITPGGRRTPEFRPEEFVRGTDTLYSLSMEGRSGAAVVAALNVAVIEAAEELSTRSPGGRLPVPFLGVLDEAANGVRWRDLPDRYSHYGSRGIILMTILQSWSQGVEVWGDHGMRKLRDAANIRVFGGGQLDAAFLEDLSRVLGEFEPETTSISVQRGAGRSRSTTVSTRPERILDLADLAALPRGRAIVLASGTRPILIETEPWTRGPRAAEVEESLARYSPPGEPVEAVDA